MMRKGGVMFSGWAAESAAFVIGVLVEQGAARHRLHPLLAVAFRHTLGGSLDHEQ